MKRIDHLIKCLFCTFLLCAFYNAVYADRILYNYDASGNRTRSRKEIILRGEFCHEDDSLPQRQNLSLHRITIYPNPTEGELRVEITGSDSFEGASITIYSVSGLIVYYKADLDTVNDINLTSCPKGIYMLVIRVDGESCIWKIIKI